MSLTPSLTKIALDALQSVECACGRAKVPKQSFCRRCFYALPAKLQSALWKSFSEGYATAYDEALDFLRQEKVVAPAQAQLFRGAM